MFGILRRYKGVEQLIRAFSSLPRPHALTLRIIGAPDSAEYGTELLDLCSQNPSIQVLLNRQDDEKLVKEIQSASFIALPYLQIYNSGVALMALTLGRPILVTRSETMVELQKEVGGSWVRLIDEWTGENLEEASRMCSTTSAPDLSARSWTKLSEAYADIYRQASGVNGRFSRGQKAR
jgi:beta-1,4-mannosyltransferase